MSEKKTKIARKIITEKQKELSDFVVNEHNIDEVLSKISREDIDPKFIIIDLFCGAGGTTTGFLEAMLNDQRIAKVISCVNHDFTAIKSHWRNNKHVLHFEEDIRTLNVHLLKRVLDYYRELYPDAYVILWASLECTNFSKAKGGQPRDADSRTLAQSLCMVWDEKTGDYIKGDSYIQILKPDFIQIENVVEFMSWGPLDENGKPISRKNGQGWMEWRKDICSLGYHDEWKELNAADLGAYTSRNRLFGCFAKNGLPIVWPEPTHAKRVDIKKGRRKESPGLFDEFNGENALKKWMPVKDVLDFTDEGESIFIDLCKKKNEKQAKAYLDKIPKKNKKSRKTAPEKTIAVFPSSIKNPVFGMEPKAVITFSNRANFDKIVSEFKEVHGDVSFYRYDPYAEATYERVYAGLVKFIGGGDTSFISKYYSGKPAGKNISIEGPAGTVTCVDGQALVQPKFLLKYNSTNKNGKHIPPSIEEPCPVVSCQGRLGVVQVELLNDVLSDPRTIIKDGMIWCEPEIEPDFLTIYNGKSKTRSVEEPAPVIATNDRFSLIQPKYFIDKHYGTSQNQSINQPAGTILPTDKHRLVKVEPFIVPTNYTNGPKSIEDPLSVITANGKYHYIVNPSHGGHCTSTEAPSPVVVARQDKAPLSVVQVEKGNVAILIFPSDSDIVVKIKYFMAIYGLVDIKMRMLRVPELLKIQGFPDEYILEGNQSDQKKFIGNSVCPIVVKKWCEAFAAKLIDMNFLKLKKVA